MKGSVFSHTIIKGDDNIYYRYFEKHDLQIGERVEFWSRDGKTAIDVTSLNPAVKKGASANHISEYLKRSSNPTEPKKSENLEPNLDAKASNSAVNFERNPTANYVKDSNMGFSEVSLADTPDIAADATANAAGPEDTGKHYGYEYAQIDHIDNTYTEISKDVKRKILIAKLLAIFGILVFAFMVTRLYFLDMKLGINLNTGLSLPALSKINTGMLVIIGIFSLVCFALTYFALQIVGKLGKSHIHKNFVRAYVKPLIIAVVGYALIWATVKYAVKGFQHENHLYLALFVVCALYFAYLKHEVFSDLAALSRVGLFTMYVPLLALGAIIFYMHELAGLCVVEAAFLLYIVGWIMIKRVGI